MTSSRGGRPPLPCRPLRSRGKKWLTHNVVELLLVDESLADGLLQLGHLFLGEEIVDGQQFCLKREESIGGRQ